MENVQVAIPSFKRCELFRTSTYRVLTEMCVPMSQCTLFLSADDPTLGEYAAQFPEIRQVVVSGGLVPKLNHIADHYDAGTRVLFVEDDVDGVVLFSNGKVGPPPPEHFRNLISLAFRATERTGLKLWGINPSTNSFYMNDRVTHGNTFVIAVMFGFISTKSPLTHVTLRSKSDYERSILHTIHHGGSLRVNFLAALTKNYKNPGGLQDVADTRAEQEEAAVRYLSHRYGFFCSRNEKRRSSPYAELSMRRIHPKSLQQNYKDHQRLWDIKHGYIKPNKP
jgi:hypothetical protein